MSKARRTSKPLDNVGPRIYFFTPYSAQSKLGQAYNEYMELVPCDEDWVCFLDRDVLFLTPDYGHQIGEIVRQHPEAGLLTCLTNRVGCRSQLYQGRMSEDRDILNHRKIAAKLQARHRCEIEELSAPISGFLMVLQKKTWRSLRFDEEKKLLQVDWDFSRRLAAKGFPIFIMRGMYVFHYYRLEGGRSDLGHLI